LIKNLCPVEYSNFLIDFNFIDKVDVLQWENSTDGKIYFVIQSTGFSECIRKPGSFVFDVNDTWNQHYKFTIFRDGSNYHHVVDIEKSLAILKRLDLINILTNDSYKCVICFKNETDPIDVRNLTSTANLYLKD
jgi:hypothetical protein